MEKLYTAKATARGGRNGHIKSEDGVLDLEVRTPKAMGGDGDGYTNPEELFAAGYAACFNSAMMLAARRKRMDADNSEVTVAVSIERDDTSYKLSAKISGVFTGITEKDAEYLMREAHNLCPYSKATRGNIDVELEWSVK